MKTRRNRMTENGKVTLTLEQLKRLVNESDVDSEYKYMWVAESDDGAYNEKSDKVFDSQEECYMDMMNTAIDKMKWNVEWNDVIEGSNEEEHDGLTTSNSYLGYNAYFYPHKIVHKSYSGEYTYKIVVVK